MYHIELQNTLKSSLDQIILLFVSLLYSDCIRIKRHRSTQHLKWSQDQIIFYLYHVTYYLLHMHFEQVEACFQNYPPSYPCHFSIAQMHKHETTPFDTTFDFNFIYYFIINIQFSAVELLKSTNMNSSSKFPKNQEHDKCMIFMMSYRR